MGHQTHPLLMMLSSQPAQTLYHIIVTGQSLGTGVTSIPVLSTSQANGNKMLNAGTRPGGSGLTSLVPLVESQQTDPINGSQQDGETVLSALTNWLVQNGVAGKFIGSDVATNGFRYTQYAKGQTPYTNSIAQVTAARSLYAGAGFTGYSVAAVICIGGEQDQAFNVTTFAANMAQLQSDYETDIKAITGQSGIIPLILCQQNSSAPSSATPQPTAGTPLGGSTAYQALQAALNNPTKIYCDGPKYQYSYASDNIHLTNHSERWLGEQKAKLVKKVCFDSQSPVPFSPSSVSISGAVITVNFNVPVPPIVLDLNMVLYQANYGFTYFDDSGSPPAISSVAITGASQVQVTLASSPTGTFRQIRYGHQQGATANAGRLNGARGNLRDSDTTASLNGYSLYNPCCQFAYTF